MGSFCIGNVGDIGGIGMVGMRGAGCGMREGVPLMRHNFYMGNVHRLGEMPGWVERSGPPKFGGLRAAVGGCTIVQGTYKADWQKSHASPGSCLRSRLRGRRDGMEESCPFQCIIYSEKSP